jgi:Ca2+-binding RTX toxin-like protein
MRVHLFPLAAPVGLLLILGAQPAIACTNNRTFDVVYGGFYHLVTTHKCEQCFGDAIQNNNGLSNYCPAVAHDACPNDGVVVKCYGSTDDVINGTTGRDIISGGGGNDVIDAKAGDDEVNGGAGDDSIYGQNGADRLNGGDTPASGVEISGDDVIHGGPGGDSIYGGGGRDVLDGEEDDDDVWTTKMQVVSPSITFDPYPDDVVGTVLCGGSGEDWVAAGGPRHQCIDAGGDANDYCLYEYDVTGGRSAESTDLGTARGCDPGDTYNLGGTLVAPSNIACGCSTDG